MNEPVDFKVIGLILGVVVGLILAAVIIGVTNKNKDGKFGKFEYDERQEKFNGKSFKLGFLVAMGYSGLLTLLGLCGVEFPVIEPIVYFSVLFVGVLAMSSYSIWTDSYWGLRTNRRMFIILMSLCTLLNFLVPIRFMIDGSFIENGKVGPTGLNLMCGIVFLAIFVQDSIRHAISKREEDE